MSEAKEQAAPADPDVREESPNTARPAHLNPTLLLLVLIGGACGAALREAVTLIVGPVGGIPYPILAVNVIGAFLLGWLLDALARRGPDAGFRRGSRLLLGTGALGGFTTYSTLAVGGAQLFAGGRAGSAVLYLAATIIVGAIATITGIATAAVSHRRRGGAS